ncbi:MAG TPA: DUF2917 domain-containing protein [Gammaproteobacteria bacterium]|nr:DUF2917 domain-containing protein [Gammaproteobacteria bacterium]
MRLVLEDREIVQLTPDRRGTVVVCREGILWMTRQGDGRDHLLRPGMALPVGKRGRVLVTALAPDSALTLSRPAQSAGKMGQG